MKMKASNSGTELVEKSFIHYVPIIIVGILICGVPSAILNSCAGIYYPVMAEDFGVPVSQISMWRTLDYITGVIVSPFAGMWLAKYNTKYVLLAAGAIESAVLISFGAAPQLWMIWVGGAIVGITNAVMLGVGVAAIINRWFRVSTGLVIGICTAFTGFGGMLFTPIGQMIIETSGWRTSYMTLGAISLIVMVVGVLIFYANRPEDRGMLPYGTAKQAAKLAEAPEEERVALCVRPSVARKSLVFWVLILFGLLINTVCNINAFFATYVEWYNAQADVVAGIMVGAFVTGAELTAFNSAGNAIGKLGLGVFSDMSVKVTLFLLCACGLLGLVFMWQFPNTILLPIGSVLFGCFIPGTLVVAPMVVRTVFGYGASYPVIWGYVGTSLGLGGAVGSYVWAAVSENLGGFTAVFGIAVVCIILVLVLGLIAYSMRDKLPRERLTEADLDR